MSPRTPALLAPAVALLLLGAEARADDGEASPTTPATTVPPASAAPSSSTAPPGMVEKVEVTSSAEGPAALDPTAFATVIKAADFADRVTSVPELLRESVGVQVQSLGGEFATVSVRGSSAEQVVIYLDGVPLNRALGGAVNLAELPLGQIESIEIYRGFTPASLPSASIGGAILIHTRRAAGRSGAASLSYGSFATGEAVASISGTRGRADLSAGADLRVTQGDFTYFDDNGTPFSSTDDAVVRRLNNAFRRDHLSGSVSVRAGERSRISVSTDLLSSRQGVPGLGTFKSLDARFDTSRYLLRSEIETPGLLGGRLLIRGAADGTWYRESFEDPLSDVGLGGRKKTDNRIRSFGQEAGGVLLAGAHQAVSLLLSHRRESADLADFGLEPGPTDLGTAVRDTLVATVEDQVSLGAGRVLLNPSLRRERYDSNFAPGAATGLVPDSLTRGDGRTTGKIGVRAQASETLTVKGNFGRFLRLPDFTELFGNRGSVQGNPALLPESGRNFDVGIAAVRRHEAGLLRQARFEATLFETLADDLILFSPVSQGVVVARNFGRARVRGAELSLDLALGRRFAGTLNATRQVAKDVSGDYADGKDLPGRPRDELSAGTTLLLGQGRLYYRFTYVGPNFIDPLNTASQALPARYLHDAGWSVRLPRGLRATIEVKNLGDDRTYDVARYPLPGRSLEGRLSWEF